MRSEQDCRRPLFEDGTPVLLADGQEWQLPRPRVRLAPASNDQGFRTVASRPDGGVFAGLMGKYEALTAGDNYSIGALANIELALGKTLLLANYDLGDDEVGDLLQFSYEEQADPEGYAIREGVMGVVCGYGAPKPSADGDESPSSSTA